jgi:hypothetical protein
LIYAAAPLSTPASAFCRFDNTLRLAAVVIDKTLNCGWAKTRPTPCGDWWKNDVEILVRIIEQRECVILLSDKLLSARAPAQLMGKERRLALWRSADGTRLVPFSTASLSVEESQLRRARAQTPGIFNDSISA